MTMLLEAVAGWLVANVLFVVWMTHLSRRGQARRLSATGNDRHGLLTAERAATDPRAGGRDGHAAA
jgi:hypothetical protein